MPPAAPLRRDTYDPSTWIRPAEELSREVLSGRYRQASLHTLPEWALLLCDSAARFCASPTLWPSLSSEMLLRLV